LPDPSGKLNMEELVRLLESFDISAEKAELLKLAAQCKARAPDGQIDWPRFLAGVQGHCFLFACLWRCVFLRVCLLHSFIRRVGVSIL
jgi:hypothetical protein